MEREHGVTQLAGIVAAEIFIAQKGQFNFIYPEERTTFCRYPNNPWSYQACNSNSQWGK